jgi:2-amino-4-hydroxy-6-hydroxymethyldihydropteridine diphosphokinase
MRAGLALGSNVGDRFENLRAARKSIVDLAAVAPPLLASPIFETDPVDCEPGAGKFWNAVIEVEFEGDARDLLKQLKQIEVSLGRAADHPRNISRKIDIDLLYLGDVTIEEVDFHLPHARLAARQFVLQPLADIRPELILPRQIMTVRELLAQTTGSIKVVALPEQWA